MQKICDSPFVICVSENYIFVVLLGEDVYHTGGRLMDDSKIIELYNARNEQAIRVTEEKYGKYCFVIAKNILSIEQDCEECVNDTWLRAWNSIPPSKPNSLKLFLAKITRNLAIDRVKRESRQKRGSGELLVSLEELCDVVSDTDSVIDELTYKHLKESLNSFLRSVSERDCDIFVSRYFYVESVEFIARKYSISAENAHKILSRTRIRLKEYLKREGYDI